MKGFKEIGEYISEDDYDQVNGSFAMGERLANKQVERVTEFFYCRETFASEFEDDKQASVLMSVKNMGVAELVFQFFAMSEEMLGIIPPSEVGFFKGRGDLILIQPNSWWAENEVRRQFMTVLLRAGLRYDGINYYKTLYGTDYTLTCKQAVDKFFDGHTHLSGQVKMSGSTGWQEIFEDDDNLDCLVKEEEKPSLIRRIKRKFQAKAKNNT